MNSLPVTVLLPVYNASKYVGEAIQSVLQQSFQEMELFVIDDGSTDSTKEIVQSFHDSRIKLITNYQNQGLSWTLNKGLELAKGKYVARMDADDICYPERIKTQFQYMEEHTDVGVLGTWVRYFGKQLQVVEKVPCDSDVIKSYMAFDNPIFHPSVMMRKSLFDKYDLRYDDTFNRSEDFHLWIRAAQHFPLSNLPYPLLRYRCHETSITSQAASIMKSQVLELLKSALVSLGVSTSDEAINFHYRVSKGERLASLARLLDAESWFTLLVRKNDESCVYPTKAFREAVGLIWNRLCFNSTHLGISALRVNRDSMLAKGVKTPAEHFLRFFLSLAVRPFMNRERAQ